MRPIVTSLADAAHLAVPRCISVGGPNGIRTRASTLRGWHPRPLDDGAAGAPGFEPGLPEPESGALPGYATPQGNRIMLPTGFARAILPGRAVPSTRTAVTTRRVR